jgi:SAM-dependent methyltransferase
LRPQGEDLELLRRALGPTTGMHLLLGATPEYAVLAPQMVAVDYNEAMLREVWPSNIAEHWAIRANWLRLPFAAGSVAAALGDGSINARAYLDEYLQLFEQLRRALVQGGRLAMRVFVRPEVAQSCRTLCDAALRREFHNFHAFKWRLAMAMLAESGAVNIGAADIYACRRRLLPDDEPLAAATGWNVDEIDTLNAYRAATISFSFPTLEQLRRSYAATFDEIGIAHGSYDLAECCPVLALRAKN